MQQSMLLLCYNRSANPSAVLCQIVLIPGQKFCPMLSCVNVNRLLLIALTAVHLHVA